MPTLEWIGKDKVINHHLDVPYQVLEEKYTFNKSGTSGNKIIKGDNLAALKSLLPEYEGKIKCIYIDPPYNTGNEKWCYNDNVNDPKIKKWLGEVVGKEGEDLSRHDKWLCMMYPRLKLLQKLLSDDGAIFISIDDNEQANLKLICDEIFGASNFISELIVQSNSAKNNANYVSITHEYMMVYSKNINQIEKYWQVKKRNVAEFKKRANLLVKNKLSLDEISEELRQLIKYPRFFDFDHYVYADEKGPFHPADLTAPGSKKFFDIIHPITKKPCKTGIRGWGFDEGTIQQLIKDKKIQFGSDDTIIPRLKKYLYDGETQLPKSVLFFDTQSTTKWIKANKFDFPFPKPLELLEYIFEMFGGDKSIILDSFSGSGTTAHAVLKVNKKDGGNRKFILVEMEDYAEEITAERVRRVIKGYSDVEGTGGDFTFYELGDRLLDESGNLNEHIELEKIRDYIWYMETHTKLPAEKTEDSSYYLGTNRDTAYYFAYEKGKLTDLNYDLLAQIKTKADNYVIYADTCTLSEPELIKYNISFRKIPRDITKL